jgi:DNA-binding beta-propeller fold protein YncE
MQALNVNGAIEYSVRLGEGSPGMAVTADGAFTYLATQLDGIVVLNTSTLKQISDISTGSFGFSVPGPVAASSSGRRRCVLEGRGLGFYSSNNVWIVNLRPLRRAGTRS